MKQFKRLIEIDETAAQNEPKFEAIKRCHLPLGHYAITGSGLLGLQNMRVIGDIEVLVTPELWKTLVDQFGIVDQQGIRKVAIEEGIEAFSEDSFYQEQKSPQIPRVIDRIAQAHVIGGLSFEPLEYILHFKRKMAREKDLKDIPVIEKLLKTLNKFELRIVVASFKEVIEKLNALKAILKGDYAFRDEIYHPQDKKYDLNVEFVRMRNYQKTNWNKKKVELSHKLLNSKRGRKGIIKIKKEFDSHEEAHAFLFDHQLAFSFSRHGVEYEWDGVKIFVEEIEGLPPTVELSSASKEKMDNLIERLVPVQVLSESVPKWIESCRN